MSRAVAIVGSGPSGCYLAQALLKAAPDLRVDLIDRLPVPYGLVRYGVAADHQGTKGVIRQFERVFERQGAGFVGNVTIGEDVSLEALREAYDAVVLAAGLSADRTLGIAGEDLQGVHRAGQLTRALYEHPDAAPLPELDSRVVIMGNGNVAIDILRLLAKTPEELAGSDLGAAPSDWLARSGIEEIQIVGRSPASAAKFDPVMIKELAKLEGISIRVLGADRSDDPEAAKKLAALEAIDGHGSGARRITFRFGLTPVELSGPDGHLKEARFLDGEGNTVILPCSVFITAIGFGAEVGLPRDLLIGEAVDREAGVLAPGLYATGWFRRGPQGTIPDNRADAQRLATRILDDFEGAPALPEKPGRQAFSDWAGAVGYHGWKRIDAAEISNAPENRCRAKIASRDAMLALALQKEEVSQ
ncbi:FAD-dependent oxidoreductase [Nitratireductor sp. L1-7-SE]|uniref:FAD-dependent oxidoreductase n=1 Tax=Nitratireductor rhodophyticola TaxID=2854036 RepID=A0ABS7R9H2_9HYPH|nr:FAD-dependent oxidoreductase [Nitratireductor rhodophyticola]MBY8917577.1 FAD-dependent oxidoreductase [Nitratireductor rhodophyticola]MBY8922288.1 FAD-dependent oxidoreductase [Nitratireductor rhodophyticola]